MVQADSASPSPPAPELSKAANVPAGLIVVAIALLLLFVASQARVLWSEWADLQGDMARVRRTAVIGYRNIHPNPSYAKKPRDWYHHEGEFTFLWACWNGDGHQWFRVGRGEVDRGRISYPIGRDVIQAIDYPLTERGGGRIWGRIPSEAPVVGFELAGTKSVYPLQVLDKVLVVNDLIGDRPYLITFNPLAERADPVRIYEPIVDGHRVTMGVSGYFHDRKPMLYDRGSESLWVESEAGVLEAIAGHHKGTQLRSIVQHTPVSWGDWREKNPESRLLIGADRSRTIPPF